MPPPRDGEAIVDEASRDRLASEPPESGEGLVGERRPEQQAAAGEALEARADDVAEDEGVEAGAFRPSGYGRPAAPSFDFGAAEATDEEENEDDDEDLSPPERSDDEDRVAMHFDEDVEEPPVDTPATRRLDEEPRDPNATTLVSVPGLGSTPPPSRISVEEAAPSSERPTARDDDGDPLAGFVPEEDEPPLSTRPEGRAAEAPAQARDEDATLAPVVDDLEDGEEEPVDFFDRDRERRRRTLRRGVGAVLAAIALGAVALVIGAATTSSEGDARASARAEAAPQALAAATKPADVPSSADEAAPSARAADEGEAASSDLAESGDYEAISAKTLELLNDREFDEARALAERLVALEPDNAFGYRCLGAALQDMAEVTEARKVYSQCVTKATRGEVSECRALGGAKL